MPGRLKELMMKEYVAELNEINDMFSISYTGLKVEETNALRDRLFACGSHMKHVHNRLFRKVLEDRECGQLSEFVNGPSAIIFGEDVIAAIKAVTEFSKEHKGIDLGGGLFEGKILTPAEVKELSDIPPREVLLCQLMNAMRGPVANMASLLNGVMSKFVGTLKEVEKKLS